ncbi:MAG: peptide-methionine (R)-S-oxide reductase MsrB [Halobacteria archaeon]|nr:peptide-methionine (R)-S-oxide reductase MsrB [Halobacteria archaeon]
MAGEKTESELPETEEEWRGVLSEEEFKILRERGTEPRFSGEYVNKNEDGTYVCAGCGAELFSSETKYDSGCGWPSFYDGEQENLEFREDTRHGMVRTEVLCKNCGGHLGHIFNDGPEPTGKRYCINSVALDFEGEN